jgi:hypothetical protein
MRFALLPGPRAPHWALLGMPTVSRQMGPR